MNIQKILNRAFEITRSYTALWFFGFVVAFTSMGGSSNGGGNHGGGGSSGLGGAASLASKVSFEIARIGPVEIAFLISGLIVLFLLAVVVFSIARVVAETALIRMVNTEEEAGYRPGVREGFRLGWSREALRVFWIELITGLAAFLVISFLLLISVVPMSLMMTNQDELEVFGAVTSIAIFIPVILVIIALIIGVVVLLEYFRRATILENLGVLDFFRRGWQLAWRRPVDTLLLALVLFAMTLAAGLVMMPLFFFLAFIGAGAAGIPGLAVGLFTSIFVQGAAPWIAGLLVGLPIFLVIIIVPITFASGLIVVFSSSTWTLAYREMTGMQVVQVEPGL